MSRKPKILCGVATIFFLIVIVVFIILGFTVFKPKNPEIIALPLGLENFAFNATTMSTNVTIGMVITVGNKNHGSFKFGNSTASVTYREEVIGEIPIPADTVPGRSRINITTNAVIMASRLLTNPNIYIDILDGNVTLTSDAMLRGKVNMLKILKLRASVSSHCDMYIAVASRTVESNCDSRIKL